MTRFFAVLLLAIVGTPLHADAEYSLTCNMKDDVAEVYVYIYASPGSCEMVGSIEFSESKDICIARYRD